MISSNLSSSNSYKPSELEGTIFAWLFANPTPYWQPESFPNSRGAFSIPFFYWIVDILRPRIVFDVSPELDCSQIAVCSAMERLQLAGKFGYGAKEPETILEPTSDSTGRSLSSLFPHLARPISLNLQGDALHATGELVDLIIMPAPDVASDLKSIISDVVSQLSERGVIVLKNYKANAVDDVVMTERLGYPAMTFNLHPGFVLIAVGKSVPVELLSLLERGKSPEFNRCVQLFFSKLGELSSIRATNSLFSNQDALENNYLGASIEKRKDVTLSIESSGRPMNLSSTTGSRVADLPLLEIENKLDERFDEIAILVNKIEIEREKFNKLNKEFLEQKAFISRIKKSKAWKSLSFLQLAPDTVTEKSEVSKQAQINFLKKSVYFDKKWYLERYPDVATSDSDPVTHYVMHGAREGRNPSSNFDTLKYRDQVPFLDEQELNPLFHYIVNKKTTMGEKK